MKINHLGIATKGIDEALKFWGDALGLENVHTEIVEDQKVRIAMLPIGESRIELLEPTGDDSPISKFLEKRGGGIHHIAVEVDDIEAALAAFCLDRDLKCEPAQWHRRARRRRDVQ